MTNNDKAAKLAEALRANLKKRKAQARAAPPEAGPSENANDVDGERADERGSD